MSSLTTAPPAAAVPAPRHAAEDARPAADGTRWAWTLPVIAGAAGYALLLRLTYAAAWAGQAPNYWLYWAGIGSLLLPLAGALTGPRTPGQVRALVGLYAVASYLPKLLRSPGHPWLYDEYAHWAQANGVLATGHLYAPNSAVPMLTPFPGLHLDIAALVRATGLDTWQAGLAVIAAAHLAIAGAVFLLAERLSHRPRLAALAALAYMTTPGWVLFDSQVSYESLALAFYAWAVAGLVAALTATTARSRGGWVAVTVAATAGAACTHHLSTGFTLVAIGVVLFCVRLKTCGITRRGVLGLVVGAAVLLTAAQLVNVPLLHYLGSVPAAGIAELSSFLTGSGSVHGVFSGSSLPLAEQIAALVIAPLTCVGIWAGHRTGRLRPAGTGSLHAAAATGITAVACGYPLAAPLVFTQVGAEAAHRSWAFTLLAAAVLAAAALDALLDLLPSPAGGPAFRVRAAATALLAVAVVGSTAAGGPAEVRFPGPARVGSDARTAGSDELRTLSTWLRDTQGGGHLVLTDEADAATMMAVGGQKTDLSFPTWDYTFFPGVTVPAMKRLASSDADFLVVDERMAQQLPLTGYYYIGFESQAFTRSSPLPGQALHKLDGASWLHTVYASVHYRVYAIDRPALQRKLTAVGAQLPDTYVTP